MTDSIQAAVSAAARCAWCLVGAVTEHGRGWAALVVTVAAVWLVHRLFLRRGPRRAPSRPPRSDKRTYVRGSGDKIGCGNPATGEHLGDRRAYTPDEVRAAYERAKEAQKEWAKVDFDERRAVLMDVLDWTLENHEQVVRWSTSESGKTRTEAVLGEVMTSLEKIRWMVAEGEQYLRPESRRVPSMLMTKAARVEYHPCGVIGVIVPWNYPYFNVVGAVTAALFSGNGALVKVSEWTSHSAEPIEDMFRQILARRGHNPDLVQIVTGFGQTGAALVESGVEKVLFIGSPAVGKLVMRAASARLTPVILELGGKDPFVVFDDVDFDHMVDVAIRGAFINCGQNCVSAERFYVQEGVHDRFVAEVARRVELMRQGAAAQSHVDVGAMTMPAQADHVTALVDEAVRDGARVVVGGQRFFKPQNGPVGKQSGGVALGAPDSRDKADRFVSSRCTFHQPTVLVGVTHKMRIANEEAFGPVMTVIKFRTEDELVDMVNRVPFGLGCSVFSRDYAKAERVAARLQSGMCTINDFSIVPVINSLPFGGMKDSGFGHFNGPEGLRGFTQIKSVVTDRFGLRAAAPAFLQYPVSERAPEIVMEGLRMVYCNGWIQSAAAAARMVKKIVVG